MTEDLFDDTPQSWEGYAICEKGHSTQLRAIDDIPANCIVCGAVIVKAVRQEGTRGAIRPEDNPIEYPVAPPTGICHMCGKPFDDHDGWRNPKGPFCRSSRR